MMKLYYSPLSSNGRRAWATMLHLGLQDKVELVPVDMSKGDHMLPDFLAVNPNHKVPALVDGDFKLWESMAIATYLCEQVPGQKLWPTTPRGRADVLRWMSWQAAHFGPAMGTFNWENVFVKVMNLPSTPGALDKATKDFHTFAPVLEAALEGKKWLVGDDVTLADFYVGAGFSYEPAAKMPLEPYKNIRAWTARLLTVPAWLNTAPKLS
jgi:glutathione S-transferase